MEGVTLLPPRAHDTGLLSEYTCCTCGAVDSEENDLQTCNGILETCWDGYQMVPLCHDSELLPILQDWKRQLPGYDGLCADDFDDKKTSDRAKRDEAIC
eukprot:6227208-Amphidinium_carterae.2